MRLRRRPSTGAAPGATQHRCESAVSQRNACISQVSAPLTGVFLWDKDSDGYINWEEFLDLGHKFPQLVELKSALQDTVYARQQARWKSGAHKANLILRGLAK